MAIKCIYHSAGNINESDDLSYSYILTATLRPPEFMGFAFSMLYGNEQCTIIGHTKEELEKAAQDYGISDNPRLIRLEIKEREQPK